MVSLQRINRVIQIPSWKDGLIFTTDATSGCSSRPLGHEAVIGTIGESRR